MELRVARSRAKCGVCGSKLPPRTEAWFDDDQGTITCVSCERLNRPDPLTVPHVNGEPLPMPARTGPLAFGEPPAPAAEPVPAVPEPVPTPVAEPVPEPVVPSSSAASTALASAGRVFDEAGPSARADEAEPDLALDPFAEPAHREADDRADRSDDSPTVRGEGRGGGGDDDRLPGSRGGRRRGDRRSGRHDAQYAGPERRSGRDRRSGSDRRGTTDRRATSDHADPVSAAPMGELFQGPPRSAGSRSERVVPRSHVAAPAPSAVDPQPSSSPRPEPRDRVGTVLRAAEERGLLWRPDRRTPGGYVIDHLVVSSNGLWVVSSQPAATGRVEKRDLGDWFTPEPRLFVGDDDHTHAVRRLDSVDVSLEKAVRGTILADVPRYKVICFIDVPPGWLDHPFPFDDSWITWSHHLVEPMLSTVQYRREEVTAMVEAVDRILQVGF